MYKMKRILFYIFIILLNCIIIESSTYEECNKLTIEGGEQALRKIFKDFEEIKTIVNDLKSNNIIDQKTEDSTEKDLPFFDERFDRMPEKYYRNLLPKDCASATACTKRSGIYKILVEKYSNEPFYVACDAETENGDWLVIQRRQDGSVDFYRDWVNYENGFGYSDGEFFIGLKKLHILTNYNGLQELLIVMEDANGTKAYAKYDGFVIGNETEAYALKRLGKYSGTAGDSLQNQIGMKFTTKDRDNDKRSNSNCAVQYTGAWWYKDCHLSNLNGKYGDNTSSKGVNWITFKGYTTTIPYVKMMIRRSRNLN